jgi:hypothetical protein
MTLTFYAAETSRSLGEFEPVVVGDEWVIRQTRQFQPPLYLRPEKRLKVVKEDTEDEEDIPNDAVEFLRGVIQRREAQG